MAHILLGWEFGGNRGHATTLLATAKALRARGHRISFALQRVDALAPDQLEGADVWPAPVTPRLLVNVARPRRGANTMGDILARLGCDDPGMVGALLRAWTRLLDAIAADLVVAEYAPYLLTAARGRLPVVAIGTAFSTPPHQMERFPSLNGDPACFDEAAILAGLNRILAAEGLPALPAYPGIFAASREIGGGFTELDPYATWRSQPLAMPNVAGGMPPLAPGTGEEVFVYAPEQVLPDAPLWEGLARSGLPVRVHTVAMLPDMADRLAALGFRVEPRPVPIQDIVERSRLLLSHGGHGFTATALFAGLPQVICYFDLEKYGYAEGLTRLGLGGKVAMSRIEPEPFAASLRRVYEDQALADRARAAAPAFRARYPTTMAEMVADAAEELLT